ncbi:MAG: glutamine--tRNA ligase [Crocinitomicaceae bacterium]|nr:glutamine--tRNA ligase [Crocinitomicaceae bacterium]
MSENKSRHFIQQMIDADLAAGKNGGVVHTRFPPEPNGYLHIGHAKAICIGFGLAKEYGGLTNLRFDDTNPIKEEVEYVDAIREDLNWLGFEPNGGEYFTSDYFNELFALALKLIDDGKAYVDDQTSEQIAEQKGTPTEPGKQSPYRDRSPAENRDLFERMKAGEFVAGSRVLRAKIDMANDNMHMRDPLMYRIMFATHHRTGDDWCIYPMYDFAHGQSDSIEGITHSLCTLEFEVHRPLYDWYIKNLDIFPSSQTEFARLNLNYTVMSKRKLLTLVEQGYVDGWDDPRMPTISGLRRRGYTPASIREFIDRVGVAKRENIIDVSLLEWALRDDLNRVAPRVMAVLNPIKLVILNYPEGQIEMLPSENNPEDPDSGTRELPFGRELFIEAEDFKIEANRKWFRLAPGKVVRLKSAYKVEYADHVCDDLGQVTEVHVNYFENSKSGSDTSGIKAKGTLHWVESSHAIDAEVRLYDRLFADPNPDGHKEKSYIEFLNPESIQVLTNCKLEPSLKNAKPGTTYQFTRLGYFTPDTKVKGVYNRASTLRDSWKG